MASEVLYHGKVLCLRRDRVLLSNGKESFREIVTHPGATCILPLTDAGITLVRQYRKPVEQALWEIPAGKLEPGEDPAISARRELAEETGLQAENLHYLGRFYTSPGYSNEIMYAYLARNPSQGNDCPDEDEILQRQTFSVAALEALIASEEIVDGKTLLTFYMAKACFPADFAD